MKNQLSIITSLSLFFFSFISIPTAQAQEIDTRIGGMIAYGTEIENIGIGANAEFGVMDKLSISPSFIYYLPKEEGPIKMDWFEVNANANYYFLSDDKFDVYGLGGLNYSSVKVSSDATFFGESYSVSDGRFGLNLGGGANMHLNNDSIMPFAELKYVIIDGGQLVLAAGVKFKI
ncbi:MAG: outer membrane protein [Psychroflexus halocasei]